jgi:hypothetical protein
MYILKIIIIKKNSMVNFKKIKYKRCSNIISLRLRCRNFINGINLRDNCIIGPCGWPKLQITPCGINMNLEIPVVGLIFKSIPRIKFR